MTFLKISVVGLGYIGLPTAAMFASRGIEVVGIDVDPKVVKTINSGGIHIIEPYLDAVVYKAVNEGKLRATLIPEASQAFLIAVPTPIDHATLEPNLDYIEAAANSIAPVIAHGNLVVLESTVPVGTTEKLCKWLSLKRPDLTFPDTDAEASDIRIAHCPERVLPGKVMQELIENDRVIGGMSKTCAELAKELYTVFVQGECVITSSPRTAELAKLTENSFRDVNIAFANELSQICDELNVNVWELISIANRHPRVNVLQPGAGVGGHCIAVDPWFIVASSPKTSNLIRTARNVNDGKPKWVLQKFREAIHACLAAKGSSETSEITVAIYGLSFKPDIDDLRESPALAIAKTIHNEHNGPIVIYEPNLSSLPSALNNAKLVSSNTENQANVSLMLVDHSAFKNLPKPAGLLIDTRGVWR
tara:strand:- start:608 stop:1864 length:1257 start_codon:yes stop_codon:yes gene_type:complete